MVLVLRNMKFLVREKTDRSGWTGAWFESNALSVTIHFPGKSDSTFQCFASGENAARSFTADLIIFDEWAFQQFDHSIWTAALPVVNRPLSGQVIGVSTIQRGSLFEELYTTPDNGFYKIFIPWYADPSRTQEWYDQTLKLSGKAAMWAEYPASVEEALDVPGGRFFEEVFGIKAVLKDYLSPFDDKNIDTLMLGCTHYALVKNCISEYLGPDITLLDIGHSVSVKAIDFLINNKLINTINKSSNFTAFLTKEDKNFFFKANKILGKYKFSDFNVNTVGT